MVKNKATNCPHLLTKDKVYYPEGYCYKYTSGLFPGLNRDCGRDCFGSQAKKQKEAKEGYDVE